MANTNARDHENDREKMQIPDFEVTNESPENRNEEKTSCPDAAPTSGSDRTPVPVAESSEEQKEKKDFRPDDWKRPGKEESAYRKWMPDKLRAIADRMMKANDPHAFVTAQTAAKEIGISYRSFQRYCDQYQRMHEAYEDFKNSQQSILIYGGLYENYNAQFTKFLLSAKFGLNEKSNVEFSGAAGKGTPAIQISFVTDDEDGNH